MSEPMTQPPEAKMTNDQILLACLETIDDGDDSYASLNYAKVKAALDVKDIELKEETLARMASDAESDALRSENARWQEADSKAVKDCFKEIDKLQATITALREALEPFAKEAPEWVFCKGSIHLKARINDGSIEDTFITVDHLRKAESALAQAKGKGA